MATPDVALIHRSPGPAGPVSGPPVTDDDKAAVQAANLSAVHAARLAEIQGIKDGLAYLTAMATGDGVLRGADHVKTAESVAAVDRFMTLVKSAAARMRADEDFQMLCVADPAPHALKFHEDHEAP